MKLFQQFSYKAISSTRSHLTIRSMLLKGTFGHLPKIVDFA